MLSLCLNKDFKLVHLVKNKWLFVEIFCLQKLVKAAENARKDHEYRKNLQVKNLTSNYLFWQHSKHGYKTYTLITSSGNIENTGIKPSN